jgi:hypothetical protein
MDIFSSASGFWFDGFFCVGFLLILIMDIMLYFNNIGTVTLIIVNPLPCQSCERNPGFSPRILLNLLVRCEY